MANLIDKSNQILNEKNTKLLPENLKAGITCLGVTGTYEGSSSTVEGIKQFATIEEMQADTTAKEGDLAVVYRNEIQNAQVDSQFQIATFPDTVVLDTAMTNHIDVRYRAVDSSVMFDCMGQLDSSNFMMRCHTETGEVRIQYTSSDGITYTRTDTTGNPVDFGTEIYYEMAEMWNDVIGKFIQVDRSTFEGLYEYSNSSWVNAPTQLTVTNSDDIMSGGIAYGNSEIITGTLGDNISGSFSDKMAMLCAKTLSVYKEMTPKVLTDSDKTIDKTIYIIPENKNGESLLDTSALTSGASLFKSFKNLIIIDSLNTSNMTSMANMFNGCSKLTAIPLLDTSNVTTMYWAFFGCTSLTEIPLLDTSNVTDIQRAFSNCSKLTAIPLLNTSNVTTMYYTFNSCTSLTEIPLLDTSNVTDMGSTFSGCSKLTTVPLLNTSKVTNMQTTFWSCSKLTTIPVLNTGNVTNMLSTFEKCTSLSDESLNNILMMCANAVKITSSSDKTLKSVGLTQEQATKCTTLSNYKAFTAAGWTTGY